MNDSTLIEKIEVEKSKLKQIVGEAVKNFESSTDLQVNNIELPTNTRQTYLGPIIIRGEIIIHLQSELIKEFENHIN